MRLAAALPLKCRDLHCVGSRLRLLTPYQRPCFAAPSRGSRSSRASNVPQKCIRNPTPTECKQHYEKMANPDDQKRKRSLEKLLKKCNKKILSDKLQSKCKGWVPIFQLSRYYPENCITKLGKAGRSSCWFFAGPLDKALSNGLRNCESEGSCRKLLRRKKKVERALPSCNKNEYCIGNKN